MLHDHHPPASQRFYALRLRNGEDPSHWLSKSRSQCAVCGSDAEFVDVIRRGQFSGIVWSVDPYSAPDSDVLHAILEVGHRRPVFLRSLLSAPIAVLALKLATRLGFFRLSIANFEDSSSAWDWFESGAPKGADQLVLRRLGRDEDKLVNRAVAAAMAARGRRIRVGELATACDSSTRTFQDQLRREGCLTPREIIAWSVCLHLAWRVEGPDPVIKRAAKAAGFASPSDLSNYVFRHFGTRPAELRRRRGFEELLETFIDLVGADSRTDGSNGARAFHQPVA